MLEVSVALQQKLSLRAKIGIGEVLITLVSQQRQITQLAKLTEGAP
jgi:hypothetical protein